MQFDNDSSTTAVTGTAGATEYNPSPPIHPSNNMSNEHQSYAFSPVGQYTTDDVQHPDGVQSNRVNALQTLGSSPFPSSLSPICPLSSLSLPPTLPPLSHSSPLSPSPLPLIQLGGLRKRCKLPKRDRSEPGHQTHFGAFRGKHAASQRTDFLYYLTDRT